MIYSLESENYKVHAEINDELEGKIIGRLIGFYIKHEAFVGEQVMQNDEAQLEAAELLADIAEEIGFEIELKSKI